MRKIFTCFKRPGIGLARLFIVVLMNFWIVPLFGQNIPVSGMVKETDGEPLLGATVVIKGTTTGTVTDINGGYKLMVNSPSDVLVFSSVGYISEEVEVGDRSSINISLTPDITQLGEIVVIGYGEVKRTDLTGTIYSVKGDEIRKSNATTFEQALQGRVPGMVVQQVSGQPGGGVSVQIRGVTSFQGGQPLYVIDGVRVEVAGSNDGGMNPLAGINPAEIESFEVLMDASATAIYGSQATNGVILITTKRGKRQSAPTVGYQFSTGFQQLPQRLPVMNLREHAAIIRDRAVVWGFDERAEFQNPEYLGEGTDWQDVLFRTSQVSEHNVSLSGGDDKTSYFLSGTYYQNDGIAFGSEIKRMSLRLNLDNQTTKWLKIGTKLQLVNIDEKVNATSSGIIQKALTQTPDIAVRNPDGSWGGPHNESGWVPRTENPFALAEINKDEANRKQVYANAYADVNIIKGMVLRNQVGGNFSIYNRERFYPSYVMGNRVKPDSEAYSDYSDLNHTEMNTTLTYDRLFAEKYKLKAMAAHEWQLNKGKNLNAYRKNYPTNTVQTIGAGDLSTATNDGRKSHSSVESYFGRLDFGFDDRYLITGNIRYDGNSKYSEQNRWILSYSGVLAWKINNESFMAGLHKLNELKLRLSYGLTNRDGGRDFSYASTLTTASTGLGGVALVNNQIGNPALKWEQTNNYNIGLDGALFDWRVNFTVNFYLRETNDLAMQIQLPLYSGTSTQSWPPGALGAPYVNIGTIENKGFDVRISTENIRRNNFTWRTDATVSHNENKVIKLNAEGASIDGWPYSKTVVGRSIGEFYGYQVEGVYANPVDFLGDAENGILPHPRPVVNGQQVPYGNAFGSVWYGDLKFKDLNGDGIIDERDQTFLGSPIPKFQFGLNNTFTYKNFDLSIFLTSNIGNKVYNITRKNHESPRGSTAYFKSVSNYARLELVDPAGSDSDVNNVYVSNPDTRIVGLRNDDTNGNGRSSDLWIEDGSFVRCKNISLGYTLPNNLTERLHLRSLKVYASATNLFTITDYSGMDPEIGSWDPRIAGYDDGYYPQPRVITFGLNLSL